MVSLSLKKVLFWRVKTIREKWLLASWFVWIALLCTSPAESFSIWCFLSDRLSHQLQPLSRQRWIGEFGCVDFFWTGFFLDSKFPHKLYTQKSALVWVHTLKAKTIGFHGSFPSPCKTVLFMQDCLGRYHFLYLWRTLSRTFVRGAHVVW